MAFVSQIVRLDMKPQKNPPHVDCTQYDSGADGLLIHFVLFNDGSEFSVPSGYTAKLEGTTKENTGFIIDPYSIDVHGVSFSFTEDATAFKGSAWCKIVFEKGSSRIATSGFWLDCDRAGVEAETVIGAPGFEEQIENAVNDWLDEHPPASGGMTEEFKQALLDCFRGVAWLNDDGKYDDLYAALYPPADVLSISAVFTQGSAVIYDTDSLDTLKQYLVVTATMTDSTTRTVTNYTLSGTLTEGTSTITVSYGGKTTSFTVDVTGTNKVLVENGAVSISDGSESDNDMRARTDFIPCTNRVFALDVLINTFNVVSYAARYYDANKQYVGHGDTNGVTPQVFGDAGSGWLAGDGTEYTDATTLTGTVAYVRFLLRTTAGTEIVSDVSGTITVDGTEYNVLYS